jgi:hypothetical protein
MTAAIASQLLYDTDQDTLFEVDELPQGKAWVSARVYKVNMEKTISYEVWIYEWDPISNKETPSFLQCFPTLEDAKSFAGQQLKLRNRVQ